MRNSHTRLKNLTEGSYVLHDVGYIYTNDYIKLSDSDVDDMYNIEIRTGTGTTFCNYWTTKGDSYKSVQVDPYNPIAAINLLTKPVGKFMLARFICAYMEE